jgi:hypothetical protein
VCDGDVLEGDVELARALEQVGADLVGDGLALGDELGGVELGDNGLEDLVTNGREDTLIVVEAEVLGAVSAAVRVFWARKQRRGCRGRLGRLGRAHLVDLGQLLDFGTVQDSQRQRDHLQVLGAGGGADVPRPCADVVDNGALQPGHQEMCALVGHLILHSRNAIEDDGAGAALDIVDGRLREGHGDGAGDDPAE